MAGPEYRLDRRELLRAAGAGVAGVVALSAPGTARVQEEAPDPEEYEAILEEMDGDGSGENPYIVTDVVELQAINGDRGGSYELGATIDASPTAAWNDGAGFDPLGAGEETFNGVLAGGDNEIQGLTIARPAADVVGLFAAMEGGVQNLSLTGCSVTGNEGVGGFAGNVTGEVDSVSVDGTVEGTKFVGGFAGTNAGQIGRLTASVDVTAEERSGGMVGANRGGLFDSTASGDVSGTSYIGGFAGVNGGDIVEGTAEGTVSGETSVGGFIAENDGNLRASRATGDVEGTETVGGFAGENWGEIYESTVSGEVSGSEFVGGFVGENWNVASTFSVSGDVTGDQVVGGLAGWNGAGGLVDNSYVTSAVTGETDAGALVGRLGWEFQEENGRAALRRSYWNSDATQLDAVGSDEPGDGETAIETVGSASSDEMYGESAASAMEALDFEQGWRALPDTFPRLRAFTPAVYQILTFTPESINATQGETIVVEAVVANTGEWDGNQDVEFRIEGDTIEQQPIPLETGEEGTVTFEIPAAQITAGAYTFSVWTRNSEETGELVVESASNSDGGNSDDGSPDDDSTDGTPIGTSDDSVDGSADGDGPGFAIPGAITGLGGAAYLLSRRFDDE